jgi:molybdopterin-guanine dinucleotide biosynthesis protein A
MDAIILAGTHQDKTKHILGKNKAFLKINNRPIIDYVVSAVKKANTINRVYVLGPKKKLSAILSGCTIIQERKSDTENLLENIKHALNSIKDKKENYLFVGCDIPLLKSHMVDDFVKKSENIEKDLILPYTPATVYKSNPITKKMSGNFHFGRFKEGKYRLGNMVIANASKINNPSIDSIYNHRKLQSGPIYERISNALYFISVAGLKNCLKLAFGKVSISEFETEIEKKFGISVKVKIVKHPEISLDVDYLPDYMTMKKLMKKTTKRPFGSSYKVNSRLPSPQDS